MLRKLVEEMKKVKRDGMGDWPYQVGKSCTNILFNYDLDKKIIENIIQIRTALMELPSLSCVILAISNPFLLFLALIYLSISTQSLNRISQSSILLQFL